MKLFQGIRYIEQLLLPFLSVTAQKERRALVTSLLTCVSLLRRGESLRGGWDNFSSMVSGILPVSLKNIYDSTFT